MRRLHLALFGLIAGFGSTAAVADIDIASQPVFLNPPDPRIMLLMSRDHELSKKAYNDYSDLNGDGRLDITYDNAIDYYGYFDSAKCYTYSDTNSRFEPAGAATNHQCSSQWSGNFLNWVSMTRMDVLRKTLYGGLRSSDNTGTALGSTVLERAMLPNDVHAFAKAFAPAGGATEVARYTPYSRSAVSFCNVTNATDGMSAGTTTSPKILVANGSYPLWGMTANPQCAVGGDADRPNAVRATLTARVAVCVSGMMEANCTAYGTSNYKPTGLLQKYGEKSVIGRVRFGLMTGSYTKNKSGGVLRKNTSWLTGNDLSANDEVNSATGQFINQAATDAGIINTINRTRIAGWSFGSTVHENACNSPGILNFNNGECVDWGNPLSEMYLESLRYFSGATAPTSAFDSTSSETTHIPSLPKVTWSDPLPSSEWCALSNVVVLSTGLNSFDRDELTGHGISGLDVAALTNEVGTTEGISGSYLIGRNGTDRTDNDQCSGKPLSSLTDADGICPEVPSLKGGYSIAGLAYSNLKVDLRPGYRTLRTRRWGDTRNSNYNADYTARQPMGTYTVSLAESLPRLEIPVTGGQVTFLPACMANSNGNATATSSGWRACSLTDMRIVDLATDANGKPTSGTIDVSWEDSTWGNDYDMDGVQRIFFNANGGNLVLTTHILRTSAGHAMRFGYTVTGSTDDGAHFPVLVRGNYNVSTNNPSPYPTAATGGTYPRGASTARQLENPLWYAAKYGTALEDKDGNGHPDWDNDGDGVPDNFFKVTNPAGLSTALGEVFEAAATADASASAIATNSTRLDTNTHVYQAIFHTPAWTGEFKAIPLTATGTLGTVAWEAGSRIPAAASRNIYTWNSRAWNDSTGAGASFTWSSITGPAATTGTQQNRLGSEAVLDYIRGDRTNEQPGGTFRARSSLLGDIVNSDPHYVAGGSFGYDLPATSTRWTETLKTAYTTFRTGTRATRKPMIYVGANDGMLHAFNASNTTAQGGGAEVFAYVPNAVIGNLPRLASPTYRHQYYVDGPANSGDAYLGDAWKTVLVGTLGGGGKAVFALDITNVTDSSGSNTFGGSNVIWEYAGTDNTSGTDHSADMGYIMGRAHVARLNDGNWYAVFGNGYNSTNQRAVLFLVPLDRSLGLPVRKIRTVRLETDTDTDNGMSEPALLDVNGDRIIDVIYAGDLKGNLWKFDLSNSNAGNWGSAYHSGSTPAPLFRAMIGTTPQPITSALEIGVPPSSVSGYMIYFGTGRYLGNSDITTTATQSAYGILDSGAVVSGRGALQQQTFIYQGARTSTDSSEVRVASNNAVAYTGTSAKRGWYIDLVLPNSTTSVGERIVTYPILRHGRVILTSIVPSSGACDQGGYSWITELDALTGGRLSYSVFDYTDDNLFNSADYARYGSGDEAAENPVTSRKLGTEGLLKAPTVISAGEREYKVGSGTGGGVVVITEKGMQGNPRSSWRQLFVR
ncbi:pilus assembly protein [Thauera sinica]|uniref:Pilus assembly protein n=1 Tax=Thauera sinica TaxID=2665146 RepID=A0ABW1AVP6_9RHOO|nr:PilC/PilY family type IV pilus protein [Thauera sp. K11]ATE60429.1 pilus assembly protein PilC [Thauera sp. K11]